MQENLIEIRDLRVAFAGEEVVHGIDLDIPRGQCLALVGESGSGKSVTAHPSCACCRQPSPAPPDRSVMPAKIWSRPAKDVCANCAATALR